MRTPFAVLLSTGVLLCAGIAAALAWWQSGDPVWIRSFFSYAGALFLIGCSLVGCWASFQCWKQFSPGDVLRPAWFFIALSAASQLVGGVVTHVLGNDSLLNPLVSLDIADKARLLQKAALIGPLFSPVYMLFLALGLFYVLKACRKNGIIGGFHVIDMLLLLVVAGYTVDFFVTVVFAPAASGRVVNVEQIIGWTSDPLLCILLVEAILIRRSIGNMGWGLVARCWLSFTAAIFLTSAGDIGLWAWWKGYLPRMLEIASWYVWFFAGAAYALGPAYQLQAILHATARHRMLGVFNSSESLQNAV
jgi:hypothetical protein